MNIKYITIFIDFEGQWGMPFKVDYDLENTTTNLLKVLNKYNFKAVFNICGVLAKVYPNIIKKINDDGHEIAIHGYVHEHLDKIESDKFEYLLEQAEHDIYKIIGKKPIGFRAPYLLSPKFYNKNIYNILRKRGYTWTSNRKIRFVNEISQPGRLRRNKLAKLINKSKLSDNLFYNNILNILLNYKLILTENIMGKDLTDRFNIFQIKKSNIAYNLKWLFKSKAPFYRDSLLEIPVLSPLDCDLINLPNPMHNSSQYLIDYGINFLTDELSKSNTYFNFNFHDWIIGTKNRLQMFDDLLSKLSENHSINVILAKDLQTVLNKYEI